jgi:hypothetical protein
MAEEEGAVAVIRGRHPLQHSERSASRSSHSSNGRALGWREIESLRLPDRLTFDIGRSNYLNIRERPNSIVTAGYEHFGIVPSSAAEVERRPSTSRGGRP